VEFEQSSRKSFEFLTQQLKALKDAFNTLSDTLLEELELLSNSVSKEIQLCKDDPRVPDLKREMKNTNDRLENQAIQTSEKICILSEKDSALERRIEQLNVDMDTVLQVCSVSRIVITFDA